MDSSDCSWMQIQINQPGYPLRIPSPTAKAKNAEPKASQRSTRIGGTERSAIAPKNSGESNAAIAEAANANGISHLKLAASNTIPIGTNHEASDMPWRKSRRVSSIRSERWINVNFGSNCNLVSRLFRETSSFLFRLHFHDRFIEQRVDTHGTDDDGRDEERK